jgi:hypothetical protein
MTLRNLLFYINDDLSEIIAAVYGFVLEKYSTVRIGNIPKWFFDKGKIFFVKNLINKLWVFGSAARHQTQLKPQVSLEPIRINF